MSTQYFVPGDNSLILDGNNQPTLTWAQTDFDDGDWQTGSFGIGYDFPNETSTIVDPDDVVSGATTIMTRTTFDLADLAAVKKMFLRMKYDDGFVAHINGTEVARSGVTGTVEWDSTAVGRFDFLGTIYQNFAFDLAETGVTLQETGNVLAIQVVNQAADGSALLLIPDLYTGVFGAGGGGNRQIPGRQDADAVIEIVGLDYNPVSSNQDEEYIQLTNNNDFAVDITNWELVGGVRMTFQPGTVISAGGSLYVTPDAKAFRARATGPSGGQQLFVQGGYRGHLSNFGETIDLLRRDATTSATFTYPGDPSPTQEFLRITEIMYNPMRPSAAELVDIPDVDNDDFEYAELTNISSTETLDLTGVRFTSGFQFDFTDSDVTSLAPGDHVLVVKDLAAFNARYGNGLDALIAGEFSDGSLNNGGEAIKLEDATNSTVAEFSYNDDTDGGWTERADGRGSSLQIVDTTGDYGDGSNWRPSAEISGSPGSAGGAPLSGLVINEVLTNTEPPSLDAIELHNSSGAAIQLGNYYLSDSAASLEALQSYSLPATTIAAGAYVVFDETQFNSSGGVENDFALSSLGDQVYLTVGDGNQATHFVDFVNFGAVAAGESLGRFPNATGALVPMVETTLNDVNSGPRVGPVIISEVNYNAGEPTASDLAIAPNMDEGDLEFVEIHNTTNDQILLTEWRMRGGVDIEFDEGSTLDAGETIVVVSFNPQNPVNADRVSAFRFHYGIEGTVRLVGGYSGQLDNGGERVTLQRPGAPVGDPVLIIPRLLEDEVRYDDVAPWPISADGNGNSLHRATSDSFGNSSSSWAALSPTPGTVDFSPGIPGDFNLDGVVDAVDINALFGAIQTGDNAPLYDVDNSGMVDQGDVEHLVENILGTFFGDANLDRTVDARDLNTIGIHWQDSGSGWEDGDFTGDGNVDARDLNLLALNWRKTAAAAAARVPRAPLAAAIVAPTLPVQPLPVQPLPVQPSAANANQIDKDPASDDRSVTSSQQAFARRQSSALPTYRPSLQGRFGRPLSVHPAHQTIKNNQPSDSAVDADAVFAKWNRW